MLAHALTAERATDQSPGSTRNADSNSQRVANSTIDFGLTKQNIPTSSPTNSNSVAQLLKKGDFKDLALFRLDVATWPEFIKILEQKDSHGLTMISQILERMPLTEDTFYAQQLVNKRKRVLKPGVSRIEELYFGKPLKPTWPQDDARELHKNVPGKKIVVTDGLESPTIITTASELLVFLMSHPAKSKDTPKGYAEPDVLQQALALMARSNKALHPDEVWNSVRQVKAQDELSDEEEDTPDLGSEAVKWPKGHWDKKEVQYGVPEEFGGKKSELQIGPQEFTDEPSEFRRDISQEDRNERLQSYARMLANMKFIGLHATTTENLGPLLIEGVSKEKFGSGHGVGKGNGFYVIPSNGKVPNLSKLEESAKAWGPHRVAVYLSEDCEPYQTIKGDTVDSLEDENTDHEKRYYVFGQAEIVIPPSLFGDIKLLRDPADITHGPTNRPAIPTKDSAVSFVDEVEKIKRENLQKK